MWCYVMLGNGKVRLCTAKLRYRSEPYSGVKVLLSLVKNSIGIVMIRQVKVWSGHVMF